MLLAGCDGRRPLRESPLPESQRNALLGGFRPPEALERIAEWYPGDWRAQLFLGLLDSSRSGRIAALRRADSLRPKEPMIAFRLCLAHLEDDGEGEGDSAEDLPGARPWLEKALSLDPANGALRVLEAYVLLREGRVPQARALFLDPRRIPGGDFYYPRLEEALLGLFSDSRRLNPYTLTEAIEIYRRVPFPPFEKWMGILYGVFLSTQDAHPYDIRSRGRDAALGLFRLGKNLRTASYSGPKVLSGGYEQRSLGFLFQLKAAEFLVHYYGTFGDTAGAERTSADLAAAQREYEAFMASGPWEEPALAAYLEGWAALLREHPEMRLSEAMGRAREWILWKRAVGVRVPKGDGSPP